MTGPQGLVIGVDGGARCWWSAQPQEYRDYHDDEWGRPVHDDRAIFEKLSLEAFQSGLSWLTILRKREGFRVAFDGFDPTVVAGYSDRDVARLLTDPGIVRNRAKVAATITNARALLGLWDADGVGALDRVLWSVRAGGRRRRRPRTSADIPATTEASAELARRLRSAGFIFVGPTTAYAAMQALGVVDDHLRGCLAAAG